MDRGAWRATVHGAAKSWNQRSDLHTHTHTHTHTGTKPWLPVLQAGSSPSEPPGKSSSDFHIFTHLFEKY